jgi:hypothetical protein
LQLKLIEKENQMRDTCKTQNEWEAKLKNRENEIDNLLELKSIEKENDIHEFKKAENKLELKLIEKENQIGELKSNIQRYKKLKSEQNKTNQEKIKLIQIENRSKISTLRNKYWKEVENGKDNLKLLEKEKRISNQELSKYHQLNAKLDLENITLKQKEKEMINNHAAQLKQFPEKIQNIKKIILETSPTNALQSETQEKKEKLQKNKSKTENYNEEFIQPEDVESKYNLKNEEEFIQSVDLEHEKQQNLENETNVETKILETPPPMELYEKFMKLNKVDQDEIDKLAVANKEEIYQFIDNEKEKMLKSSHIYTIYTVWDILFCL